MAAAQYYDVVQKMYVGYFGRPADPAGLQYWAEKLSANGGDLTAITTGFGNSAEAKALWGSLDTQVAIDALYQQLFNRSAEPAGLIYWTNKIADGTETLATIARALVQGAQNDDVTTLAKKVAVAARYTDAADDTTANILAYKGDAAAAAARAQLKNVTKDTDATTFDVAAIVTAVAAGSTSANTGSTYTLTSGTDNFTGTANNDTFNAGETNPGGGVVDTFTAGDTIDGGAGTDTLKMIKTAAITALPTGITVTNVEALSLTSGATVVANTTSGFTGLTDVTVTSVGDADITASSTHNVTTTTSSAAANTITVNGGNAVSVTATGITSGSVTVGSTTAAAGAVTVNATGTYSNAGGAGADNVTLGAIQVTGGTTATVNQTSGITSAQITAALALNTNDTFTYGAVTVTGNSSTTAVTANQDLAAVSIDNSGNAGQGRNAIVGGAVTVNDANKDSATAAGTITTVSVKNAGAVTVNSGALTTLNLEGTIASVAANTLGALTTPANTALTVNLTGATVSGTLNIDQDIKTINISGNTTASTVATLTNAAATTLNVSGDAKVTLSAFTPTAVTAVTVTNTGGFSMTGTAIGTSATFTGGSGADGVSLGATTKAIDMGAGDDTVIYGGAVGTGGSVTGGTGNDTIQMSVAEASAADNDSTFNSKFTGFEYLVIEDSMNTTLDVDGLNNVSKVTLNTGANTGTINNIDTGGSIVIKANNTTSLVIGVDGALAGAADSITIKGDKTAGILAMASLQIANVETVNFDLADTATTGSAANVHTATLVAAATTSVVVTGNNGLNLDSSGAAAITSFDASGVVANSTTASPGVEATTDTTANLKVTYTSANTTASATVTIKGGAGDDTLTGNAAKDTIDGGAGADIIGGAAGIDSITGGEGADQITGGLGTDTIILTETTSAADNIRYAESGAVNVDTVTGFKVGVDTIGFSIGNISGNDSANDTLSTMGGADISGTIAAGSFTTETVAVNTNLTAADATNFLFLSNTSATSFATAIGTAVVTATTDTNTSGLSVTEGVAAVWYDATNSQAVFGYIEDTNGNGTALTSADTFHEIARIGVTSTDYTMANMDSALFAY